MPMNHRNHYIQNFPARAQPGDPLSRLTHSRSISCTPEAAQLIDAVVKNPDDAWFGVTHGDDCRELIMELDRIAASLGAEEGYLKMLRERIANIYVDTIAHTGRWL
jgi:hypothetical protein